MADKTVSVPDDQFSVRIITPTSGGSDGTYPVLVWFHGGGGSFQAAADVTPVVVLMFHQDGNSGTLAWTTITSELLPLSLT